MRFSSDFVNYFIICTHPKSETKEFSGYGGSDIKSFFGSVSGPKLRNALKGTLW